MGVLRMMIPAQGIRPRLREIGGSACRIGESEKGAGGRLLLLGKFTASVGEERLPKLRREGTLIRSPQEEVAQRELGSLVRRCAAGDGEAWRELVGAQHRRIYAICYRFTGSATEAEDLTQEVFLKLYRNLASFDVERGSFQPWITAMTRNLLVDHFRRTRLERASDSLDAGYAGDEDGATMGDRLADARPSQETLASGAELRERIQQALTHLAPELREAVILRDLEDMDYREIAQTLRVPEGTVKSRISRGRRELGRILRRIEGEGQVI
ncbi:MAG: sigma-70 family RNA polymerase sigma factor [Acidobacteriaceae bacterium]|nr:sigma-70 family RNA polymerase sigma factor [Acidobacteriaceae bacterium]